MELEGWIRSWWRTDLDILNPEGWFTRGQGQGAYLWEPDTVVNETAL